jgi:Fe-S oxidoreductase
VKTLLDQQELRELEALCVQECAPNCTAACPLHVDVRAMAAEIQQGNFTTGLQILKKSLPFPGIIGRICDQPCRAVCKRNEAIEIAALERACADWGELPAESGPKVAPRKQRVAIVGGGLSGLTAAYDLAKKRYSVVIFEARSALGGSLWSIPDDRLPRSVIEAETSQLAKMGVEVRLNVTVGLTPDSGSTYLGQLTREFNAVYLATGANTGSRFTYSGGALVVDPVTYATDQAGMFAGGDILGNHPSNSSVAASKSPAAAMSDGRRAALSIERFIQRVSLTASRTNEGPYESCLYTNTEGQQTLPVTRRANPKAGYTQTEATQEAGRCLQCECMECVKSCEFLKKFGSYPKKYARQIYGNMTIVLGTRSTNKLINACSLCGLCKELCPTDFDMGDLCKQARRVLVEQGHMPPSAHDFALRDMQFSNSEKFAFARHQPGTQASSYVFFPGCQLSASAPEQVEKTYAYLREKLDGVGLMLRCCGAPADWAGRADLFQNARSELSAQLAEMGNPRVILACSSCYQIFKANFPEVEIVSLWELFDQLGLPEHTRPAGVKEISIHDPCTTRYESQIQDSVRRLAGRLGYTVNELPLTREKTTCCSYGGLMWLANPGLAGEVVENRIAASPDDYLTYCAMCRDFFAAHGKRTFHLLDLIFDEAPESRAARKGPGYSQRHENRARLKQKLLKEVWGETVDNQKNYESIQLLLTGEVQKLLEDRLILIEDIQQVIEYAERTGRKFIQPQTGHFLAHYKPVQVTYWVEYAPQADGFAIFNAYSHRMEFNEGMKS